MKKWKFVKCKDLKDARKKLSEFIEKDNSLQYKLCVENGCYGFKYK